MLRNLLSKLYDGDAGRAGGGSNPGASARGRYAAVNSYTQSLARWREIATTDLVQLMQARFKRLLLDFEMTYSAEQISHPGERGRLLEETLKSFLTSVLPNRTGVGSGQVVAALERTPSKQVDIVLYDAMNYLLLLSEGTYQLFPNEAVLTVIEVKSKLNKTKGEISCVASTFRSC